MHNFIDTLKCNSSAKLSILLILSAGCVGLIQSCGSLFMIHSFPLSLSEFAKSMS